MPPELTVYHCPRCGLQNDVCGTLEAPGGQELPVFQCDSCVSAVKFFEDGAETFEVAFTYAVGPDGRPVDVPGPSWAR